MASHKRGRQSFALPESPVITAWASVAGKKEAEGPLAHTFDLKCRDTYFGQDTWEQAENHMQKQALKKLAEKAGILLTDFDLVFSGDLLNQCIGSFTEASSLDDFTEWSIPKYGFMKLDRFGKLLERWLPVRNLEDMKIPTVICATDFDHAKSVGWGKGEIVPRVLASCCIDRKSTRLNSSHWS